MRADRIAGALRRGHRRDRKRTGGDAGPAGRGPTDPAAQPRLAQIGVVLVVAESFDVLASVGEELITG